MLKATLAKTGVAFLSECMECLGGQGYVEEGGIAVLYRDTQVNAIWEGTTNVLSHDFLRVLCGRDGQATLNALDRYVTTSVAKGESCTKLGSFPQRLKGVYMKWRNRVTNTEESALRSHARGLVLWLGRVVGAVEMMCDAATDGDEVEIECCERVFDFKNQGWDSDSRSAMRMDQRIVFGDELGSTALQAKL